MGGGPAHQPGTWGGGCIGLKAVLGPALWVDFDEAHQHAPVQVGAGALNGGAQGPEELPRLDENALLYVDPGEVLVAGGDAVVHDVRVAEEVLPTRRLHDTSGGGIYADATVTATSVNIGGTNTPDDTRSGSDADTWGTSASFSCNYSTGCN